MVSYMRRNLLSGLVIGCMGLMVVDTHAQRASPDKITGKTEGKSRDKTKLRKKNERPAPIVIIDLVRQDSYNQTIPVIGRFVARQSGVIAAQVNGAIEEFRVDVGDRVAPRDVLAVLARNRLKWQHELKRSQVSNQVAQLKTKHQEIVLLRQEMYRLQSLNRSPAFSQARLDDKLQQIAVAESEAAEAQAKLSTARANQKLTEINLRDAAVKAPYAGVVTKKHTSVGAYVKVGAPVVTLLNDQNMEIEADVPSTRIPGLAGETEVDALIDKVRHIRAKVRAVIPEENPRTRTLAVRFTPIFPKGQDSLIATNQSVVLSLPAGQGRSVLTVHKDAVINRKGKTIVMLFVEGKAQPRPVQLGPPTGSRFIVDRGLKAHDKVIVRGNERLLPGTRIRHKLTAPSADTDGKTAEPKPARTNPS